MECTTNDDFVSTALQVAELLDVDELFAAGLVNEAASKSSLFDRSVAETSVYLFHSHRQHALECIRIVLLLSRCVMDQHNRDRFESIIAHIETELKKLHTSIRSLNDACLQSIEKIKQGIEAIAMSERKEQVLKAQVQQTDMEFMKNRKALLIQDMELLAVIMTEIVLRKNFTFDDFRATLGKLQQVTSMDYVALSLLPCTALYICQLFHMKPNNFDEDDGGNGVLVEAFDKQTIVEVHKMMSNQWKEHCWQMRRLGALIHLWMLCGINGACQLDDSIAGHFQFQRDIRLASQDMLQSGAFELLMAEILIPLRLSENGFETKMTWINIFSQKDIDIANVESFNVQNQVLLHLIFDSIEILVESIITKLTFLLRDARLAQEDRQLTQQSYSYDQDEAKTTDDSNNFGLEIFFNCLSCLSFGRPEFSDKFLTDVDSDLFGFLAWASSCATSSIISSYSDFLASLATNPTSASKIHGILLGKDRKSSQPIPSKQMFQISWASVFETFRYYIANIRPAPSSFPTTSIPTIIHQDVPEIDFEACTILIAYLELLSATVAKDEESRVWLLDEKKEIHALNDLFDLTTYVTSGDLRAALWKAIGSFCVLPDDDTLFRVWEYLDERYSSAYAYYNSARYLGKPAVDKAMKANVLTLEPTSVSLVSPNEAVEFIHLLNILVHPATIKSQIGLTVSFPPNLGIGYRSPGIGIFVDFVIDGLINMPSESVQSLPKILLQLIAKSTQFLFDCLSSYNLDSVSDVFRFAFNTPKSISGTDLSLRELISRHPGALVMTYLFDGPLFFKLISLLSSSPVSKVNSATVIDLSVPNYNQSIVFAIMGSLHAALCHEESFLSTVVPLLRDSLQPNDSLYKMIRGLNIKSLASFFLQSPQSLVQLGLMLGSTNTSLVNYSVAILDTLSNSAIITEKKGRNKLIDIFAICSERRQIRYTLSNRIYSTLDNISDKTYLDSTIVILRFLLSHLPQNRHQITSSHILLGFHANEQGSLSGSSERGCIGSEVSPMRAIFDLLHIEIVPGIGAQEVLSLKELASAIILAIYEADMTSTILRDIYGSMRTLLPLNDLQRELKAKQIGHDQLSELSTDLRYRAILLQIISLDIHMLSVDNSASSLQAWLAFLFDSSNDPAGSNFTSEITSPANSYDVGFQTNVIVEVAGLEFDDSHRDRIDAIFADLKLPFSSRISRFGYEEIDITKVSQLMLIMDRQRTDKRDSKDFLQTQKSPLESMIQYNSVMELNVARNRYLFAWTLYILIILEDCFNHWDRADKFQLIEVLQGKLAERLITLRRIDQVASKSLSTALLAVESTLKMRSAHKTTFDLAQDTVKGLATAEKIFAAFQSTFSDENIRENFYIYFAYQVDGFQNAASQHDSSEMTKLRDEAIREVRRVLVTKKYRLLDHLMSDTINADWNCQLHATMLFTSLCRLDKLDEISVLLPYLDERKYLSALGSSLAHFYTTAAKQAVLEGEWVSSLPDLLIPS